MSNALTWTVAALLGQTTVPDIQGLPTLVHKKK